ncbi:MAG: hypothetical protein ACYSWR_04575 [Planctomycetota bacterium]|jgi:hypothetical protein
MFFEGQTASKAPGLQQVMLRRKHPAKVGCFSLSQSEAHLIVETPATKMRAPSRKFLAGSSKVIRGEADKGFGVRAMGVRMAGE